MCHTGANGDRSDDISDPLIELFHQSHPDGNQNHKRHIKKYRYRQYKSRKPNRIHRIFIGEHGNELIRDHCSSAGITHKLAQNDSQTDREADTSHHTSKSIIDHIDQTAHGISFCIHCIHQRNSCQESQKQRAEDQRDRRIHFHFRAEYDHDSNRNNQTKKQKTC